MHGSGIGSHGRVEIMAWLDPTLWLLSAYIAVFAVLSFRKQQFNWLWGSIVLWLGFGVLSSHLLPGVLGITHLANAYPVYGYITLAALFPLAANWQADPQGRGYLLNGCGGFLALLAVSGWVQHLSFALLLTLFYWQAPILLPSALLNYALLPLHWMACQAMLMLLMWLHRRIGRQPVFLFSALQLQGVFLISLLMQAVLFVHPQVLWWLIGWLFR